MRNTQIRQKIVRSGVTKPFLVIFAAKIVRNMNRSRYACATLKTYALLIIAQADAIPCVIILSVSVRHVSCIFLLVNTYARFIVCVSQNLRRAYERFICKKWWQGHGVGL